MVRVCLSKAVLTAVAMTVAVVVLSGCGQYTPAYIKPLPPETRALIAQKGMREDSPIMIRIFKEEAVLEVWRQKDDGHYYLLKSYPICNYSGKLGPKQSQGDRQAPEGFYVVSRDQLNPRSHYHLSFNIGYPNAFDRAYGRTGNNIMVHGDCKSAGCYAMTDAMIEEIYIMAQDALLGGQDYFMIQAYPFRMTAANMAKHRDDKWYKFWEQLKPGYDYFEATRLQPSILVCNKSYVVNAAFVDRNPRVNPAGRCPSYQYLPVQRFTPPPQQTAEAKPTSLEASPLASRMGLGFGPAKPTYHMFTLGPASPAPGQ